MYCSSICIWLARFLLRFDPSTSIYYNHEDNARNYGNRLFGYMRLHIVEVSCKHFRLCH